MGVKDYVRHSERVAPQHEPSYSRQIPIWLVTQSLTEVPASSTVHRNLHHLLSYCAVLGERLRFVPATKRQHFSSHWHDSLYQFVKLSGWNRLQWCKMFVLFFCCIYAQCWHWPSILTKKIYSKPPPDSLLQEISNRFTLQSISWQHLM